MSEHSPSAVLHTVVFCLAAVLMLGVSEGVSLGGAATTTISTDGAYTFVPLPWSMAGQPNLTFAVSGCGAAVPECFLELRLSGPELAPDADPDADGDTDEVLVDVSAVSGRVFVFTEDTTEFGTLSVISLEGVVYHFSLVPGAMALTAVRGSPAQAASVSIPADFRVARIEIASGVAPVNWTVAVPAPVSCAEYGYVCPTDYTRTPGTPMCNSASSCTREDCCTGNPTCASFDSLSLCGPWATPGPDSTVCSGLNCTTEDCCIGNPTCASVMCPPLYLSKDPATSCTAQNCSLADCCITSCGSSGPTCPESALANSPDQPCTACDFSECCSERPRCGTYNGTGYVGCAAAGTHAFDGAALCSSLSCTDSDCCAAATSVGFPVIAGWAYLPHSVGPPLSFVSFGVVSNSQGATPTYGCPEGKSCAFTVLLSSGEWTDSPSPTAPYTRAYQLSISLSSSGATSVLLRTPRGNAGGALPRGTTTAPRNTFWVSWAHGVLSAGAGLVRGVEVALSYPDPEFAGVNTVGFASNGEGLVDPVFFVTPPALPTCEEGFWGMGFECPADAPPKLNSTECSTAPCTVDDCCNVPHCDVVISGPTSTGCPGGLFAVSGVLGGRPYYTCASDPSTVLFYGPIAPTSFLSGLGWNLLAGGAGASGMHVNTDPASSAELITLPWAFHDSQDPRMVDDLSIICAGQHCSTFTGCSGLAGPQTLLNATRVCAQDPCTAAECCVPVNPTCRGYTCPWGSTPSNASAPCAAPKCTVEECCTANPTCESYFFAPEVHCPPGVAQQLSLSTVCPRSTCTFSDCCSGTVITTTSLSSASASPVVVPSGFQFLSWAVTGLSGLNFSATCFGTGCAFAVNLTNTARTAATMISVYPELRSHTQVKIVTAGRTTCLGRLTLDTTTNVTLALGWSAATGLISVGQVLSGVAARNPPKGSSVTCTDPAKAAVNTVGFASLVSSAYFVVLAPAAVQCQGGYTAFSRCTAECGGGSQSSPFVIAAQPLYGGACPLNGTTLTRACNTQPCATVVATSADFTFVPLPWGTGNKVSTFGLNGLAFTTAGCGSSCVYDILLSSAASASDPSAQTYQLDVSTSEASSTAFLYPGTGMVEAPMGGGEGTSPVSPPTSLWVSWAAGRIALGRGPVVGQGPATILFDDPTPTPVNYVYFASGYSPVTYTVAYPTCGTVGFTCPTNFTVKAPGTQCQTTTCNRTECCTANPTCSTYGGGCPAGVSTAKALTTVCTSLTCNLTDCCAAHPTCQTGFRGTCDKDFTVKSTAVCSSLSCSKTDCCIPIPKCAAYGGCPATHAPKPLSTACTSYACSLTDCCIAYKNCSTYAGTCSSGFTKKNATAFCGSTTTNCNSTDCCAANPTCASSGFDCSAYDAFPKATTVVCGSLTCNRTECCTTEVASRPFSVSGALPGHSPAQSVASTGVEDAATAAAEAAGSLAVAP